MATSETSPAAKEKPPADRRMRRARLIRDGMSWRKACLVSGYSQSVADRGPRGYVDGNDGHRRPGIMRDFEKAAAETVWKPDLLKKISTHRLATAVVDGRSSDVAREIELLGRFKEHDWFVSAGNSGTVGIFAVLADPDGAAILEQTAADMKLYKDGFEFSCAWCSEECGSAESLQLHALTCTKRPVTVQAITSSGATGEARQ